MAHLSAKRFLMLVLMVGASWIGAANPTNADVLAEYLFWNNMGNAAGSAVKNYGDYKAERDLWRKKIAEGEAKLKACGNCAQRGEIEKELRQWKDTENRFQEIAGQAFVAVGMPRNVAKALGIDMPLTPGLSAEERRKMHEVALPAWADDRPEFCRQAVGEYVGCLRNFKSSRKTVFTGNATMPGGECYDLRKLERHCAAENYEAFHTEVALQKQRAAGAIIPEYLEYKHEVYYGDVPDDFIPAVPTDIVLATLKENKKPYEVRFSMRKQHPDLLSVMAVRPFHHNTVVPNNHCQGMDQPETEVERRICYDFYDLSRQVRPPVLFCQYSRADGNVPLYPEAYKFWYRPPPKEADPRLLLARAENHPILSVGETRTECPATRREAEALQVQWQAKVSKIRAATPQISEREHLPKPQWLADMNEKNAEQYENLQRRKERTKAFPFEGVYTFETTLKGKAIAGRCTMHSSGMVENRLYLLHCRHAGGETLQQVRHPIDGMVHIDWQIEGKRQLIYYMVDPDDPNALVGSSDHRALMTTEKHDNLNSGRLVRTDNLTPLNAFPVKGVYRYEGSNKGMTESGQCIVSTYKRQQPPPFQFDCVSDAGIKFSNTAQHRENTLHISWSSRKGINMGSLAFIVADESIDARTEGQVLLGWSVHNGVARLMRTGDLPTEPEPVSPEVRVQQLRAAAEERKEQAKAAQKIPSARPMTEKKVEPSRRCTLEEVAGTYRTIYGLLVCKMSEGVLDCCYGGQCLKKARLALDETGQNMAGTWDDTRRNGTVSFPLSPKCELESGRWKLSDREAYGSWRVVGKMP